MKICTPRITVPSQHLYDINIKNYIYSTNLFMCWTTNNNTCDNHTGISLV